VPTYNPVSQILQSHVLTVSRNLPDVDNQVAYTGVGFRPTVLIFHGAGLNIDDASWGFYSGTTPTQGAVQEYANLFTQNPGALIRQGHALGAYVDATVVSLDADGFTLQWTKTGAPVGQLQGSMICLR